MGLIAAIGVRINAYIPHERKEEEREMSSFSFVFSPTSFVAPGDVPTLSCSVFTIFYTQYCTASSPFLWFIAMRTRSGTGCFLSHLPRPLPRHVLQ